MNRKSMVLFTMAAAAFAQTNMKVRFGDGTGLDIHTESTGSNLPVSTSGSDVVPAGYDFHRVVFDKQGALLLGYDIEARKAGQARSLFGSSPSTQLSLRSAGTANGWTSQP